MIPGIPGYDETQELVKECASPPTFSCPALTIRSTGPMPEDVEIQTLLSEAINRIIKHHHKSLKERVSWAQLMCGDLGLVHSLIQVFSFGFKSARLFGKNLSVWDFFLKVFCLEFFHCLFVVFLFSSSLLHILNFYYFSACFDSFVVLFA